MERLCRGARDERSLPHTDAIAGTLNLLPPSIVGGMLKHVDFVASDVPGFTFPVYLAGARVGRYTAFGPTIGTAANLTLLSYDGTCCVGVTIDEASVADPDVFAECLCEGFDEVLALGGEHTPARLPLRDDGLPLRDDGLPRRDEPLPDGAAPSGAPLPDEPLPDEPLPVESGVRVTEPAWSA
jgi:hypothetical protein